jgi:glycosyltransferase involved in cell wall biosynthesis
MSEKTSAGRPLRILSIINLPWDGRLGAARAWIELTQVWEKEGQIVEKFCLTDAFPRSPRSRLGSAWQQLFFRVKAAAYVRRNRKRFDVIDCLVGTLPYQKRSLGFSGLVVARSVGLFRSYGRFLRNSHVRWPNQPKGHWYGSFFHRFLAHRSRVDSETNLRRCDVINVPNEDERSELAQDSRLKVPIMVEPYGLTDDFREALSSAAAPAPERFANQMICFIGMWSLRKGSRDWPKIIAAIRREYPRTKFLLLGTMVPDEVVLSDVGTSEGITCQRNFSERELPTLLSRCTIALFPSYIEGFGLAVVEQLAARLPTLAYDVSGPRQILAPLRDQLLVPEGDAAALAAHANSILGSGVADYERLSKDCLALAANYRWEAIAGRTIAQYRAHLSSLGKKAQSANLT